MSQFHFWAIFKHHLRFDHFNSCVGRLDGHKMDFFFFFLLIFRWHHHLHHLIFTIVFMFHRPSVPYTNYSVNLSICADDLSKQWICDLSHILFFFSVSFFYFFSLFFFLNFTIEFNAMQHCLDFMFYCNKSHNNLIVNRMLIFSYVTLFILCWMSVV